MVAVATTRSGRSRWAAMVNNKMVIGALCIASVGAAVTGTLSVFSATATRSQTVTAGTFAFNLTDNGTGMFTTAISGMAPGDTADRTVNATNPAGDLSYGSIALSASANPSSLLDTDAANGLQVAINLCSVAWTQAVSTGPATCGGAATVLTASQPLKNLIALGPTYTTGLAALNGGGTDHIMFHYLLPTVAGNSVQGQTSTVLYTFTATQAAGTTH